MLQDRERPCVGKVAGFFRGSTVVHKHCATSILTVFECRYSVYCALIKFIVVVFKCLAHSCFRLFFCIIFHHFLRGT